MTEKDLNEVAPWGKTWGRTSKREYKNIVQNLSYEVEKQRYITLLRDQLYNGCSDIWQTEHLNKGKEPNK